MLSPGDLASWYERLNIPDPTRSVINHIRSSGPARRVGSGYQNVSGRYPSKKMGVTIQFESHRVELAAIYDLSTTRKSLSTLIRRLPSDSTTRAQTARDWS